MANDQRWRAALTRLTRLAQREPEARTWIEEMLERNLPGILGAAIEVAAQTGPPLPELLTAVLERNASPQASEAVARSVPIDATALQDLAIAAIRSLLARPGWPPGEPAPEAARRRHALRVALATRLARAGRLGEARAVAEQAVAESQADLGEFASARARDVDAYDVIAQAQLASGDAEGAVRSARRALALRQNWLTRSASGPRASADSGSRCSASARSARRARSSPRPRPARGTCWNITATR